MRKLMFTVAILLSFVSLIWGQNVQVTIQSPDTVTAGTSAQFTATVMGNGNLVPNAPLAWSVSGQRSSNTVIDTANGILTITVAKDETATELLVTLTAIPAVTIGQVTEQKTVKIVGGVSGGGSNIEIQIPPEVQKGATVQLTAIVDGLLISAFDWYVSGNNSQNTMVQMGTLYVGADETAEVLTIKAVFKQDGSEAITTINVAGNGGTPQFVPVTGITLNIPAPSGVYQVDQGYEVSLSSATVQPSDATNKQIIWNVTGATRTSDNRVQFNQTGTAVITATVTNGLTETSNYTQTWNVTVTGNVVSPVTAEILSPGTVQAGSTAQFSANVMVNGNLFSGAQLTWSVSGQNSPNTTINSSSGTLTVAADETATALLVSVTAMTASASGTDQKTVQIIGGGAPQFVPVTGITMNIPAPSGVYQVDQGYEVSLSSATVQPSDATNTQITWNVTGATRTSDNRVQFNQTGTAVITATVTNGLTETSNYTQTWQVTVTQPVVSPLTVTIQSSDSIVVGSSAQFAATVMLNGNQISGAQLTWSVSGQQSPNTNINSNNGLFTVAADETADFLIVSVMAVTSTYASDITKKTIKVVSGGTPQFVPVTGITLNIPAAALNVYQVEQGYEVSLSSATVQPSDATNKQITWNVTGATRTSDNRVQFDKVGTATITATITNGLSATSNYTQTWQVTVSPPVVTPEFVKVDSIKAFFPKFATVGDAFFLGNEMVMPATATNRSIEWSVEGADFSSLVTFSKAGTITITATIKNGLTATTNYVQTWTVFVSLPVQYTLTINVGATAQTMEFSAYDTVSIKANAAPASQEFERWKVTSKNKPVILDSADLFNETLKFLMPKMDLEVTPMYKQIAKPIEYVLTVGGGTGANSYAKNAAVSVNATIPEGYVFGYWDIFPAGVLNVDHQNPSLSFAMPETDLAIRAILSKAQTAGTKTIEIASIVEQANVSGWVSTTTGNSEINAAATENGITITASVSKDGFAAINSDVSPNASQNDSIVVDYTSSSEWRLYLDIPGVSYAEGYFVTLPATSAQSAARFALAKKLSTGALSFSIEDFKNELGQSISTKEAEMVVGMSFAPATNGAEAEASITIASLDVYMTGDGIVAPVFAAVPKASFTASPVPGGIVFGKAPQNAKVGVYNAKGKVLYYGVASDGLRIDVAPGAYIVRIKAPGISSSRVVNVK
ncbi:MAG: hypothetical protein FWC26_05875 [Fibromonadales bacterium]|nr:hypothetical protein [Fibromonadales bacterium]